ncbi:NUDIX domain-containing protein [Micromonospora musae]|uniref:NUDIX domain-containing protein n=1 Tax=Micromonospora musae TaxID=1894970 RepID=UPI0033F8AD05
MQHERKLVSTSRAARDLDVHPSTLWRWQQAGRITPAWTTPGGQARWDLEELHRQLGIHRGGDHVPEEATKPERSPVVAGIVTSDRGVLIGRRHDGKPPWTFIAGEIEPGESPADAAVREVKEETGLLVRAAEREIGRRVHPKTGRTMVYLACYPTGKRDVFVGDEDELAEVKWASLAEAEQLLPGLFEPVLEHLRRELT